jgi:hypothetical protein
LTAIPATMQPIVWPRPNPPIPIQRRSHSLEKSWSHLRGVCEIHRLNVNRLLRAFAQRQ